jgi:Na+/H+-dicarboxylate symporter
MEQKFGSFEVNMMLTVVVVAIAVGLLYLTWKQYQQPAQDRFSLPERYLMVRDQVITLLYVAAVMLVVLALTLALVGVWRDESLVPYVALSIIAVLTFWVTLRAQRAIYQIFFCQLPTTTSRA